MKKIICILLAFACMVSVCACAGNRGKKESKKQTAEQIAVSLAERAGEIGLDNALSELTVKSETTVDGDTFYRFQQNYQGLPVYGRSVVYAADSEGREIAVSSNASDISKSLSTTPVLSESEAIDAASGALAGELGEGECSAAACELCIFNLSGAEDRLAYWIQANYYTDTIYCYEVIVDAETGEILLSQSTVAAENDTGYTASDAEKKDGFPVWKEDDDGAPRYYLTDTDLGISVRTFKNKKSETTSFFGKESSHFYGEKRDFSTPIVSDDNIFGNGKEAALHYEDAVRLMRLVSRLQTQMQDNFGFQTITGKTLLYIDDGFDGGKNARGGRDCLKNGLISVGTVTGVDDVDVISHEYGHVISFAIVGWTLQTTENAAINEAFSDVFGELMEAKLTQLNAPDWQMKGDNISVHRDLSTPSKTGNYANYSEIGTNKDENQYTMSTIISHAFYLMWNGINEDSKKKLNADELLNLWLRTLLLLPSNADFTTCRMMAEVAAKSIHLSDKQLACVGEAFEEVGIRKYSGSADYTTGCTFDLTVLTKDGQPYDNYSYQISGVQAKDGQETVVNTYYRAEAVITDEPQRITLKPGAYTITIQNSIGEPDPVTISVNVEKNGQTNSVVIATDYSSKPLVETVFTDTRDVEDYWGGRTIDVAIPKINLKSTEIEELNDYIFQTYTDECKWALESLEQTGYTDLQNIRYDWYANGDLLTVYIDVEHIEYSSKEIYNISITEERQLTTKETLEIIGISESEFREKVREAIGSACLDMVMKVFADPEIGSEWIEQCYNITISDDTVDKAIPFLDENGQMCILGTIYVGAGGSGYFSQIINLETFTLSEWYGTDFEALREEKKSKLYASVPEPYASFLRDDKNVKNKTGYCLYDIDGDGTDELLLSGTGFGAITYEVYCCNAQKNGLVLAGAGEDMSGVSYSPGTHAIISVWRDMNNMNPIYMYAVEQLKNGQLELVTNFTYYSADDRYTFENGTAASAEECEKYTSDIIYLKFTDLE